MSELSSAASPFEAPRVGAPAATSGAGTMPSAAAGIFAGLVAATGGKSAAAAPSMVIAAVDRPASADQAGPGIQADVDGEVEALEADVAIAEVEIAAVDPETRAIDAAAPEDDAGAAAPPSGNSEVGALTATQIVDDSAAAPATPAQQAASTAATAPAEPKTTTQPEANDAGTEGGAPPGPTDAAAKAAAPSTASAGAPSGESDKADGTSESEGEVALHGPATQATGDPPVIAGSGQRLVLSPAPDAALQSTSEPSQATMGRAAIAGTHGPAPAPLRAGEPGRPPAAKASADPGAAATGNDNAADGPDEAAGSNPDPAGPPSRSAGSDVGPARPFAALMNTEFGERPGHPAASIPSTPENPVFASSAGTASPVVRAALHTMPGGLPSLPVRAIAIHIAQRLDAGERRFEIRLDPPELGRIDVRLEISREGHVTAQLTADRPETLDALQRDARGLERALQTAGLDTREDGLSFQLREHGAERRGPSADRGQSETDEDGATDNIGEVSEPRLVRIDGVDLRI